MKISILSTFTFYKSGGRKLNTKLKLKSQTKLWEIGISELNYFDFVNFCSIYHVNYWLLKNYVNKYYSYL